MTSDTPPAAPGPSAGPGELAKQYRPADHEGRVWQRWIDADAFHADPARVLRGEARPYCILIPPPNVTAALHLGHAFNNTLQDMLIRAHRMMGFEALWMPGTDHAGIATQAVVEKRIQKEENKRRTDFSREAFVARVQAFKDEYEATITGQLKAMGCSCDWERQRFTMDPVCTRAVREAFFRLFKDGLIYRGKRLVNWDPALQTAVADDECYDEEVDSFFYYLRYPVVTADGAPLTFNQLAARGYPVPESIEQAAGEPAYITVATTRPETYLGDTAVAINPADPRAAALRGLHFKLPLVGRVIPIVEDAYVVLPESLARTDEEKADPKAKFATGFLKVTPAHDANDAELGQRHNLAAINMMSPDGRVSDKHGWTDTGDAAVFLGKKMPEARKMVVKEFESRGLLESTRPYRHSLKFSDRSKAVIEPYLSDQWYVKVTDPRMAPAANEALAPGQRSPSIGGTGVPPVQPPGDPYGRLAPVGPGLNAYKRNLPHLQEGGAPYWVTFRAVGTLSPEERTLVLNACRHWHGERLELHAAVVMPDHVHLLFSPFEQSPGQWHSLAEILHSIKSFTSHAIGKLRGTKGQVWQDESFDRRIRGDHEFNEKLRYIGENPVKEGLVADWLEYPHLHVSEFARGKQLEFPDRIRASEHRGDACATDTSEQDSLSLGGTGVPPAQGTTLTFHPARYAKTYEHWHDNIRDWCISRQLWWGHRVPVWNSILADTAGAEPEDLISGKPSPRLQATIDLYREYFAEAGVGTDILIQPRADEVQVWLDLCPRTELAECAIDVLSLAYQLPIALFDQTPGSKSRKKMYDVSSGMTPDGLRRRLGEAGSRLAGASDRALDLALRIAANLEAPYTQDPDVLDTWFSSALWPLSTMGWPDAAAAAQDTGVADFPALLPAFNPTSTLCTAREIITLWVSRMVMFNQYFLGPAPFRDVFVHAVIQDGEGRKMSKSLGNGVDPLDIIATHGSDAMRFTLCHMATQTQDVRLPVLKGEGGRNTSPKFDLGRNFATKLWNAAKFTMGILSSPSEASPTQPRRPDSLPDRWMLARLAAAIDDCNRALRDYEFAAYAQTVYTLLWNDFCDWYLEAIKPTVAANPAQQAALAATFDAILRLLHPVMPFVTEAIYESFVGTPSLREGFSGVQRLTLTPARKAGLLCTAGWPLADASLRDADAESRFAAVQSLVTAIREVRAQHKVAFKRRITLHMSAADHNTLGDSAALVDTLTNAAITAAAPTGANVSINVDAREYRLSDLADAADAVDTSAERERLERLVGDLTKSRATLEGRLANPGYALKAPPHMVQQTKDQLAKAEAELAAAEAALRALP